MDDDTFIIALSFLLIPFLSTRNFASIRFSLLAEKLCLFAATDPRIRCSFRDLVRPSTCVMREEEAGFTVRRVPRFIDYSR